jgi:autotransporter-associated beta strand protein
MKTYKFTRSLFRSQAFPCAITLSLLAAGSASAADGTWTGGTSVTWATGTNWSGGIAPGGTAANSDKATFNSGTYAIAPTAANSYFIGGLIFGSSSGAITITTGTGNNRLNVDSGGILVDASLGAVSIGAADTQGASIVANQNWANNSSSLLTVNRVSVDNASSAGTYTLTINGSGSGGVNFLNTIGDVNNASNASNLFALQINSTGGNTTISSGNTFTGGTTLAQGNLLLGNNAALGTGSLALNGGKISSNATGGQAPANSTTIGGNITLGDTVNTGKLTFSGTMSLGGDTRTLTTDSSVEFSGVVSNGGITKLGASTLTFLGASANTYSGPTTVSAGGLTLGKTAVDAIAGNVLVNGGTLTLGAADQINNTSNIEVFSGTFALGANSDTVNNVKLTGGIITGTTGVLTSSTAYDFQSSGSVTGILAGTAGANKTTAGTVTFSGGNANTYTGLTTVSAGILVLGRSTGVVALAGDALVNGGTLQITNPNQITDTANLEVATNGTFAMGSNSDTVNNVKLTGGIITGTATGVLTSSTAYDFQSSGNVTGILAGTAGANKTTTGTVTFSGGNANTYTGLTTVSAGILELGRTAGVVALAGNALVNGGTLQILNANQINDTANLEVATNGTFALGGNTDTVNNLKLTGGTITGTTGILTSTTAFDFQSSGNIAAVLAGTAGANKTTDGTVTFSGANANTYTGLTTVSAGSLVLSKTPGVVALAGDALVNGGTLRIAGVNQIVDTANLEVVTGGTFALGGNTDTVNGVKLTGGTITGTSTNGILTSITAYDLQSGSSTAVLAGTAGATKATAGTVTLTKANTYTGATTVSAGTLAVTGSLDATDVSVNAGTLAGNGNIGGNVTIASGARHALAVAATAGAQATRAITGTLALDAGNVLDLTAAATPASGVYVLATATTAITGSPTTINYNGITGGTISVDTASSPNRLLLTIAGSPYDTWAASFLPADVSNPAGNNDGDGLTNLQEFAFGTNPTDSTGEIVYSDGTLTTPGAPKLVAASGTYSMVFGRRADYVAAGLTYTVQFSADLVTWVDNDDVANVPAQVATDNTINVMSVTYPATIVTQSGTPNPKFSRVKVVLAP